MGNQPGGEEVDPVRVGRFEWERLMMMSDLPEPDRFKLLALGMFMSADGSSARPGNAGLAEFGPHEETWKKLLRRTVTAGWLMLLARGGARRGSGGTTVRRASVYAASAPRKVWERREEILGSRPYRAASVEGSPVPASKEAPDVVSAGLKEALETPFNGPGSLKEASDASFIGSDGSLKEAPRDTLHSSLKEASGVLKEASGGFEGSTAALPHHVVTPSTSTTPPAKPVTEPSGKGGGGGLQQQNDDSVLTAAAAFLQDLPAPWTAGRRTARGLAPLLAEVVASQGWQLDDELAAKLTENPGGVISYSAVLPGRIENLPKRVTAHVTAASPKCNECDELGYRYHDPITQLRPYWCPCRASQTDAA